MNPEKPFFAILLGCLVKVFIQLLFRKTIIPIMLAVLATTLSACDSDDEDSNPPQAVETSEEGPPPPPEPVDTTETNETTKQKSLRFIAVGDVGSGSPDQYKVAEAMKNKCNSDGCDFVLLLGDNIYNDGVDSIADIYLAGHDHSRQWLDVTCQGTELVISGAGSKTTNLPGDNAYLYQSSTLGFLYIAIEGQTLNAQFIDSHGNVDFSRQINKP